MRAGGTRHRPLARRGHPDQRGQLDVRRRGVERPARDLAPQRRDQDRRRDRRRADARGGRPRARAGRRRRPGRPPGAGRCSPRRRPCATRRGRWRPASPRWRRPTSCARSPPHPLRDLVTPQRAAAAVGRPRAGALRHLVRVLPPLGGRRHRPETGVLRSGTFAHRDAAAARRRGDGLRRGLPAADPPDRHHQPQGPEQHPDPRPGRRRLAVGDRRRPRAATTRSTRTSAPSRTSTPSSPRPASSGWRSRSTRPAGLARPPVGHRAPGVVHRRCADGTIAYAENPPKKYQDIYPINFDNDPDGIYAEVPAGAAALDVARRAHLPGRQPAHQAGQRSGSG